MEETLFSKTSASTRLLPQAQCFSPPHTRCIFTHLYLPSTGRFISVIVWTNRILYILNKKHTLRSCYADRRDFLVCVAVFRVRMRNGEKNIDPISFLMYSKVGRQSINYRELSAHFPQNPVCRYALSEDPKGLAPAILEGTARVPHAQTGKPPGPDCQLQELGLQARRC